MFTPGTAGFFAAPSWTVGFAGARAAGFVDRFACSCFTRAITAIIHHAGRECEPVAGHAMLRVVDDALDAACAAAGRGEWPACLSALLATWRAAKVPALAELIERVSPRVAAEPCAPQAAAVRARLAAATELDVAPILEMTLREVRTTPGAYGYAVRLADRVAPDPRIARALASFIRNPPFKGRNVLSGALYADVVAALDHIDDPRFRALVVNEWRYLEPARGRIRKDRAAFDALAAIAQAIEHRPPPPVLDGLDAVLATIDAALATTAAKRRADTRSATELLDAIYDNPLDDGLRLVCADALQEAGDPRGELIALQLTRGDGPVTKRERELLVQHGRSWLGAIEPIVRKQGVVFRRGFVACAREGLQATAHRPLLAAREWRTVEELDHNVWGDNAVALLTAPRMALRRVFGARFPDLDAILDKLGTVPWTTLGFRTFATVDELAWSRLARAAPALPALVELDLSALDDARRALDALGGSPLAAQLRRVTLAAEARRPFGDLLARARSTAIPEIALVPAYAFPGDPEGEALRIAGDTLTLVFHQTKLDGRYAAHVLAQLPAGSLAAVTIEAPPKSRRDPKTWPRLEAALATHGLPLPA